LQGQPAQAEHPAEKDSEGSVFVAQPLLAVWFFQRLTKPHSQEWLCYKDKNETKELAVSSTSLYKSGYS
jgi:hypothetical protein